MKARAWLVTGVYGAPTWLRLATDNQLALPGPDEKIEIAEVGSWGGVWVALRAALSPYREPRCTCPFDYAGPNDDCEIHGRGGPADCFSKDDASRTARAVTPVPSSDGASR